MDYKNTANKLTNNLRRLKYAPLVLILALVMSAGVGFYLYYREYRDFASYKSALTQSKTTSVGQGSVVVFGDTRTGDSVHTQITDIIYGLNPAAVFHLGDAVADGSNASQWQTFNQIEGKLIRNFNFYIASGNHEKESQLFYDNFALPGNEKWYSVNYQGVHWVVLNSNLDLAPGSPQYAWLESDLSQTREKDPFTAVVLHQSLYTSANHAADNVPYKQALIALFKKYGVDIVFSGHDHDYERSLDDNIYYLVCGSAGAPLYQPKYPNDKSQKFLSSYNYCVVENTNNKLTVNAYNEKSEKIDSVEIGLTQ